MYTYSFACETLLAEDDVTQRSGDMPLLENEAKVA